MTKFIEFITNKRKKLIYRNELPRDRKQKNSNDLRSSDLNDRKKNAIFEAFSSSEDRPKNVHFCALVSMISKLLWVLPILLRFAFRNPLRQLT